MSYLKIYWKIKKELDANGIDNFASRTELTEYIAKKIKEEISCINYMIRNILPPKQDMEIDGYLSIYNIRNKKALQKMNRDGQVPKLAKKKILGVTFYQKSFLKTQGIK